MSEQAHNAVGCTKHHGAPSPCPWCRLKYVEYWLPQVLRNMKLEHRKHHFIPAPAAKECIAVLEGLVAALEIDR